MDNGVSAALIEKIRTRKALPPKIVYSQAITAAQFALQGKSQPLPLQKSLTKKIGVEGVIEIVMITGYYSMIATVIQAFDVPPCPRT